MSTSVLSTAPSSPSSVLLSVGDDMHDCPADLDRWPVLADALRRCDDLIRPIYDDADGRALRHQRWHKNVATVAALGGTFAILCALVEASQLVENHWPDWIEFLFVLLALFAVGLGLTMRCHKQWLVQRNKAERCRFLKFRFLIQPALWSGDAAALQIRENELREEMHELKAMNGVEQMEEWATSEQLMDLLSTHEHGPSAAGTLPALTEYYLEKRVRYQLDYLERRIARNERWNRLTAHWPFWLFFASIVFALLHFVGGLWYHEENPTVRWFIFLAAALPALSAGVSSVRSAHQFARNKKRYQHCRDALLKIGAHLRKETPPAIRFRDFVMCESKLEAEHRNWLHLMTEAEWF